MKKLILRRWDSDDKYPRRVTAAFDGDVKKKIATVYADGSITLQVPEVDVVHIKELVP